jgi:6-phosphogluconolactonase
MRADRNDLENAAGEYEQVLRTFTNPQGALDVILLGVGVDGHIFSLYPGCSEITTPTGLVVALRNPPMDPAVDRLTLTPLALQAARHVLVLVQGENKAAALARIFDPATTETEVPAKLVARAKGSVSILADRAAARLVTHLALV